MGETDIWHKFHTTVVPEMKTGMKLLLIPFSEEKILYPYILYHSLLK